MTTGSQSPQRAETAARRDRVLLAGGIVGAVLAVLCCATPLLAALLGAVGLTAWLAQADYVLIPALILCLCLIGLALRLRAR